MSGPSKQFYPVTLLLKCMSSTVSGHVYICQWCRFFSFLTIFMIGLWNYSDGVVFFIIHISLLNVQYLNLVEEVLRQIDICTLVVAFFSNSNLRFSILNSCCVCILITYRLETHSRVLYIKYLLYSQTYIKRSQQGLIRHMTS